MRRAPSSRVDIWYGVGGPDGALGRGWDVDRNGQRFLVDPDAQAAPAPSGDAKAPPPPPVRLNVVLNSLGGLKRRSTSQ